MTFFWFYMIIIRFMFIKITKYVITIIEERLFEKEILSITPKFHIPLFITDLIF